MLDESPVTLRFEGREPGSRWAVDDNTVYHSGAPVWRVGDVRTVAADLARFYLAMDRGQKWRMWTVLSDLAAAPAPSTVPKTSTRASRKSPAKPSSPLSSSAVADSSPNPTPLEKN